MRLLDRIELPYIANPQNAPIVKTQLVNMAVFRLYKKGNPIGQAWNKMWGGGSFVCDCAVVAAVNGWQDLPAHRFGNPEWYKSAAPRYDGDVNVVADEVARIQREDEADRIAKKVKAAERAASRKAARLMKESGYVLMYVHPASIEKINGLLRHGDKCDVLDCGSRKVLVLS